MGVTDPVRGVNGPKDGHRVDAGLEQLRRAVLADFPVSFLRHGPLHDVHHEPEEPARRDRCST